MKRLSFYLFLCAVLLMSVNVFGQFSGEGSGTPADPYQVATAEQFTEIVNNPYAYFVQTADITFDNSTNFPQINFGGLYDGQGYKIIAQSNQTQPLFGTVTGTITRVTVEMGTNTVQNGGAILCNTLNGGTISYCNIQGNVTGATAGGIVNTMSSGLVGYCSFTGHVRAQGRCSYAGGICAKQDGGEIKCSMVPSGSLIESILTTPDMLDYCLPSSAGIANCSTKDAKVTSCYSDASADAWNQLNSSNAPGFVNVDQLANGGNIKNCIAQDRWILLGGELIAMLLNIGNDPVAFVVDDDGNLVCVATLLDPTRSKGMKCVSRKSDDFNNLETWEYDPFDSDSGTKQFIISAGHTVTLQGNTNGISDVSIIVRDGGNFINRTDVDVTATMEKNITDDKWNFIGFPVQDNTANGYGVAPLAAVEGDIWALRYDYQNNTWDNTYLHWYEGSQDYVKAGNGIFAYPDNNYTLSIEGTLNNADVTVTNTITPSENGTARWMALANPYPAEINIASLPATQGGGVYLYDGTSFGTIQSSGTIKAGQGFFVNMPEAENSFTFTKTMINNSTAKSVSAEREFVSVSVSTDGYKVPVLFAQNDDATDGYDIYDANKMFGNGTVAEPYLVCEGIELCKEEVLSSSYTATMNVKSSESRSVEIVADNIPEGYSLTLIDGALEVVMNQGDVYTTDIAEGENADRFKLLITKNNVSIADVAEAESIRVVNNNRTISIYGGNDVRTEVYNALGQKVYETSDRVFDLNNVASGAYILKVSDGKTVNSTKIVVE